MEKGWSAKGLLKPLWGSVGGRDGLERATGISGSTLSAYNAGSRPLGIVNARRIAAALNVSLLDLGAPEEADQKLAEALTVRLASIEAELAALHRSREQGTEGILRRLVALEVGLRRLSQQLARLLSDDEAAQ